MRSLILGFIAILFCGFVACKRAENAPAQKKSMTDCLADLNRIPEMAALLKSRSRDNGERDALPLDGMQLALTINGTLQSKADPEADIDDWCYTENSPENFQKLINALKQNDIPPTVNFVYGKMLDPDLQSLWIESGNLVGNMTYSRLNAKKKTARQIIADIERNDQVIAALPGDSLRAPKFFRYPRLKSSKDDQTREDVKAYLKSKGYLEAPSTIDARDSHLSQIYCAAVARGDQTCANLIKEHFKMMLLDSTLRARNIARKLAGYDVKHVLMIGANQFTCDNLAEILAWYKSLGVKFIKLDEALRDPFYAAVNEDAHPLALTVIRKTRRAQLAEEGGK